MSDPSKTSTPEPGALPPLWAVWRNPIVIRCWRARMRPRAFTPLALIVLLACAFLFFFIFNLMTQRGGIEAERAATAVLMPLFFIQAFLLLFSGTGAVAGGIVEEESMGMIDYQRLTPLPPAWKVVGYLFGLPIREYCLAALVLPFLILVVVIGNVPLTSVLTVYAVLLSSTVLYHMTGYIAGLSVRNPRLAARTVQVAVVLLYILLPQLSAFGYVVFEHLTVRPVVIEQWGPLAVASYGGDVRRPEWQEVEIFGLGLPQAVFSLLIQGSLIAVAVTMALRKWKASSRHALGRIPALALQGGAAFLILGNLLPLLERGIIFPSVAAAGRGGRWSFLFSGEAGAGEGGAVVALFALILIVLGALLVQAITPTHDESIRGLRRARRLSWKRVPLTADEASALPWALGIGAVSAFVVHAFGRAMATSDAMAGLNFPSGGILPLALATLLPAVTLAAVSETWQKRGLTFLLLALWTFPALLALVLGAVSDTVAVPGFYVATLSPLTTPFIAMVGEGVAWEAAAAHSHPALIFGLTAQSALAIWTITRCLRHHRSLARSVHDA